MSYGNHRPCAEKVVVSSDTFSEAATDQAHYPRPSPCQTGCGGRCGGGQRCGYPQIEHQDSWPLENECGGLSDLNCEKSAGCCDKDDYPHPHPHPHPEHPSHPRPEVSCHGGCGGRCGGGCGYPQIEHEVPWYVDECGGLSDLNCEKRAGCCDKDDHHHDGPGYHEDSIPQSELPVMVAAKPIPVATAKGAPKAVTKNVFVASPKTTPMVTVATVAPATTVTVPAESQSDASSIKQVPVTFGDSARFHLAIRGYDVGSSAIYLNSKPGATVRLDVGRPFNFNVTGNGVDTFILTDLPSGGPASKPIPGAPAAISEGTYSFTATKATPSYFFYRSTVNPNIGGLCTVNK